ncbi:SGNH/GDSL hydrolase family protein [Streptomyces tanashiensis]|uniref:SGNH/GDSL hydrolase family protein n=1 Tax=Streptomyces tanashiensis TaxID=67367 RepID=UPI0036E826DC
MSDFGRISAILNSDTPDLWLTTGDSITHGPLWTNGRRSYPERFQERVRWELGKPKNRDFVIDTGVSGSTTNDLITTLADRVAAFALTSCRPCWGTNDVATTTGPTVHRADLRSAVNYVRALPDGAVPVVQTPNPIDVSPWPGRSSLGDYAQTMREAAAELDVVLIDHHAHGTSVAGRYPPPSSATDSTPTTAAIS